MLHAEIGRWHLCHFADILVSSMARILDNVCVSQVVT